MITNLSQYTTEVARRGTEIAIGDFMLRTPFASDVIRNRFEVTAIPTEVSEILYAQHDGQELKGLKRFGEFSMLPMDQAFEFYERMVDEFSEYEMDGLLCPDVRIKGGTIWRKKWYPFAWDQDNNDHLCLDFDPTEKGMAGQVIYCPREWGAIKWHANSFVEFLQSYFEKLSAREFKLDDSPIREFDCRVNPFGT